LYNLIEVILNAVILEVE